MAIAVHNIYRYIWRKKLYAVRSMSLMYLMILFTLATRIVDFGEMCRNVKFNHKVILSGDLSQIGFITITIILCTNIQGIIVSLCHLKGLGKNSTWFLKLRKVFLAITVLLCLLTLTDFFYIIFTRKGRESEKI